MAHDSHHQIRCRFGDGYSLVGLLPGEGGHALTTRLKRYRDPKRDGTSVVAFPAGIQATEGRPTRSDGDQSLAPARRSRGSAGEPRAIGKALARATMSCTDTKGYIVDCKIVQHVALSLSISPEVGNVRNSALFRLIEIITTCPEWLVLWT